MEIYIHHIIYKWPDETQIDFSLKGKFENFHIYYFSKVRKFPIKKKFKLDICIMQYSFFQNIIHPT